MNNRYTRSFERYQKYTRYSLVVLIAMLFAIGAGCRSDDDMPADVDPTEIIGGPTPTIASASTPEASAAAKPIVTRTPSPSPTRTVAVTTSTPDPLVGMEELALSDLKFSACGLSKSNGNNGTAPAPTPTPVPESESNVSGTTASRFEYLARARSISDDFSSWSESFEETWAFDLSPRQQAAALTILEIKTENLCEAADLLEATDDLAGTHALLREAIRARHAWAALAIEHLIESGSARTEFLSKGRLSTHDLADELRGSLDSIGSGSSAGGISLKLSHYDMEMRLPTGWFLRGSYRNPIVVAPYDFQLRDLAGLGSAGWNKGVSIRLRRFRNSGLITSSEAIERFSGLINSLGVSQSQTAGSLLGVDAVFTIVDADESDWEFTVVVVVVGGDTVVVDYGCPQAHPEWCNAARDVVDSFSMGAE